MKKLAFLFCLLPALSYGQNKVSSTAELLTVVKADKGGLFNPDKGTRIKFTLTGNVKLELGLKTAAGKDNNSYFIDCDSAIIDNEKGMLYAYNK